MSHRDEFSQKVAAARFRRKIAQGHGEKQTTLYGGTPMSAQIIGRPMEILLVEDDLLQARLALAAIGRGQFRHRTTVVRDGQEALDFAFQRGIFRQAPRPDLILLDLRLPKIDGLDVLAEVKTDSQLCSIPVVIMTSSQDEEDRLACTEHHVEAYLTKPLDLPKFLSLLAQLKQFWHEDMILPRALARA
jgi:two-component system response regulator